MIHKMQIDKESYRTRKYNKIFIRNVMTTWSLNGFIYRLPLEFHGLNGYHIYGPWSSKDWMGILYASSRVQGFDWLLYMCPFKFQGLNGYYICGL
jgi:hypothetical protein